MSVKSAKEFVDAINGSTTRWEKFKQIQEREVTEGILKINRPLRLISDVDTRWNSTYMLIERVLLLRSAVDKAMSDMSELHDCASIDWFALEILESFLKPFFEATEKISGSKYSSISLVTRLVPRLEFHSKKVWIDKNVDNAAAAFREKTASYKTHLMTDVTLTASVLDPRLKLRGFDDSTLTR